MYTLLLKRLKSASLVQYNIFLIAVEIQILGYVFYWDHSLDGIFFIHITYHGKCS
jgi:hypothetical protein